MAAPELAELPAPPDRASNDRRTERLRLYRATAAVIAHAAADGGVLLVLEDLHWADNDTVSVLRHAARARRSSTRSTSS